MRVSRLLFASLLALFIATSAAAGAFDEGQRLFREDRPREAIPLLERAVLEAGADERAWLYLALSYQQLGRLDDAAGAFRKGLPGAQRYRALFLYNLGNVYALQGKNAFAADMYGEALSADPAYAPAYLNRANSRLSTRDLPGAAADYRRYLDLEPASPQRSAIEALLAKLDGAVSEAARLAAEAEAKRIAEAAAKQALLDQVTASLKAAAAETTSLSTGSGDVQGYGDELKLDE